MKAFLALSLLFSAAASASDVVIGGTAISIPAPPGYIRVTPAMPDLWALAQASTAPGSRAVAIFVDEQARHGAGFERGMNVQVLPKFEGHQWTAGEFAKLKKWVVDGNNTAAVDSARAAAIEKVNGNLEALTGESWDPKVHKVLALPPHLDTGEQLAYSEITTMGGVAPDGTDAKEQVTTISVILIKRRLLYVYVEGGASDLAWTRDVAQKWVAAMIAANSLPASKQGQVPTSQ